VHVGSRIRLRRRQLALSQSALAESLGLTFQQVQKYERGANRVSASMLFKTAQKLDVQIAYFFDGLPGQSENKGDLGLSPAVHAALIEIPSLSRVGELSREQRTALNVLLKTMVGAGPAD